MFFLTAAHCAEEVPGSTSYRISELKGELGPNQRQKLGTVKRTGWDSVPLNKDLDIEAVRYEGVSGIEPRQIYGESAPIDVKEAGIVHVGTRVCFSGARTDALFPSGVRCGDVSSQESLKIEGRDSEQWCLDQPAIQGDSGGPVWIEGTGTAVGSVSSGTNFEACFSPLLADPSDPTDPYQPYIPSAFSDPRLAPLDGLTTRG